MLKAIGGFPLRAAIFGLLVFATILSLTLAVAQDASPPHDSEALASWMKANAQPFLTTEPSESVRDLAALEGIVGDARIVALGEGTHGTREFFQLKHRIVQYLATEMGFNVFAIEANLPEAWRINDYVLGGPGDARELIAGMHFWTWDTEEVLDLVEWMRHFNASGKGRIEFTGFDMQNPDTAASNVRRFLALHEPAWADSVTAIRNLAPPDPGFVTSTGRLPVKEFAGHKVRYSGFIKTKNVSNYAGLWMRADLGPQRAVAFDNMRNQQVNGTQDWARYSIELTIPADADTLRFGCLMSGEGEAWFDSLAIEVDGTLWQSKDIDLDLENPDGPIGMTQKPIHPRFAITMDEAVANRGARSLHLSGTPPYAGPDPGFVTATGFLPPRDFAGHKVRYSGWIRTEDVAQFTGLWMRADAKGKSVAFDNMQSQKVRGTRDWSRFSIDLTIPKETDNINFGVLLSGEGKAWFDALTLEVDGRRWQTTDIDLELEDPAWPTGFRHYKHPRYSMAMDERATSSGERCLRLTAGPPVSDSIHPKDASLAARRLVDHLEASRSRFEKESSPAEADWVIRNAHVLLQSQMKQGQSYGAVRDSCMAANLEWTIEEARKGSRVVIWAHNGHIQKLGPMMGGWLAKRYGDDYVAIGFATNEGTYTAMPRDSGTLSSKNVLLPGPAGSIEASATATELPRFLLDLKLARQTPEVEALLSAPLLMRSIGAVADPQQFFPTAVLDGYDALAWIARTEPSRVFGLATTQLKR